MWYKVQTGTSANGAELVLLDLQDPDQPAADGELETPDRHVSSVLSSVNLLL